MLAELNQIWSIVAIDPVIRAPIAISLGAVPGALSRYYLTLLFVRWFGIQFPYGTLFINLTGAGLMGVFTILSAKFATVTDLQWLIAVGFLGAYTTFSTYALDASNLLRTGHCKNTLLYWWGSPILGFLSIELGMFLARLIG